MQSPTPSSTRLEERLTKLFPPGWPETRARIHGVIIRDRKLDITPLVWSLVFGFAIGDDRAIEDLRRTYRTFADQSLSSTGFHDRFTAALADLLRELIDRALEDASAPTRWPTSSTGSAT